MRLMRVVVLLWPLISISVEAKRISDVLYDVGASKMSERANVTQPDDSCCMPFSDGYFEFVAGGSGRVPGGIYSMSGFLAEARATSNAFYGIDMPHKLILDVVYGIDTSDLIQGAKLMKGGSASVDPPVLHDLRNESKSMQILASVHELVKLQSGATSVMMPQGTTSSFCGSCDFATGKGIIDESKVIKTLLDISSRHDSAAKSRYDSAGMTRFAQPAINRMTQAKMMAMMKLTTQGGLTMTRSELNSYLSDVCGEEATEEDSLHPKRLVRSSSGRVSKVRMFADEDERKQHVQSCVNNTRSTFAVVEFTTQFLEQLVEGLRVVLQPEGKTFRTFLEERQGAAERTNRASEIRSDALSQMKPWLK